MWSCVERGVAAEPGQVGHQDRVGGLVELGAAGVRGGLAVQQRVARHRPVGQLLAVEQEQRGRPGRGDVAVGQQPGEGLVQVAGEHLAVGAEVGRLAVGRSPRPAPTGPTGWPATRRSRPGRSCPRWPSARWPTGSSGSRLAAWPWSAGKRAAAQPGVVGRPAGRYSAAISDERAAQRLLRDGHGLRLGPAEAQRQGHAWPPGRGDVLGGHDCPSGAEVYGRQRVRGVQLGEAVAGGARVPDARRRRRGARVSAM